MMLQPFAPEIVTEGEWSFLFFSGEFSHAVCKTPAQGDYRIQHYHGRRYTHVTPTPQQLEQARQVMESLPQIPAYGRVDGIMRNGKLLVMEVELIEPFLYMLPDEDAVTRAAAALANTVKACSGR